MSAIKLISKKNLGLGIIIKNKLAIGIVTDGDIRRHINNVGSPQNSNILDLINKNYSYANLESNLEEIKNIMKEKKIITLPVIDGNHKLLGLIQYYDI